MRAFVTGASGFIGGHLVELLNRKAWEVVCLTRDPAGLRWSDPKILQVKGDLSDRGAISRGMAKADVAFHLAALYKFGVKPESRYDESNVGGTRNVLEVSRDLGVPVVYCSTAGILGRSRGRPMTEEDRWNGPPVTPYDRTKLQAQRIVDRAAADGQDVTWVFPGAVFGPRDTSPNGAVLARIAADRMWAQPPFDTRLTWVLVRDVAEGLLFGHERGASGEGYVLADRVLTVPEFYRAFAERAGKKVRGRIRPTAVKALASLASLQSRLTGRPPLVTREMLELSKWNVVVDSTKARRDLGWTPTPFDHAMDETVAWFLRAYGPRTS